MKTYKTHDVIPAVVPAPSVEKQAQPNESKARTEARKKTRVRAGFLKSLSLISFNEYISPVSFKHKTPLIFPLPTLSNRLERHSAETVEPLNNGTLRLMRH